MPRKAEDGRRGTKQRVHLRPTTPADLEFVLGIEHSRENRPYLILWSREEHLAALQDADVAHWIVETAAEARPVGYVILAGLDNRHQSVELRRLVIDEKGKGFGKEVVRLVKRFVFRELRAHRLWLDVKSTNSRAHWLYWREGFVLEGVLRDCLRGPNGYESLMVMSILAHENRGHSVSNRIRNIRYLRAG